MVPLGYLTVTGMEVVDQREIQRRGGVCARIPVACIVRLLLRDAGVEAGSLVVFDITYGEGRFWAASRPRLLIGADIAVLDWVVKPDIFIPAPAWQSWKILERLGVRVDMVAVDPPWVERGNSKRRHFGLDRALGSTRLILEAAATAAKELGARYLLVHYKERWIPDGFSVAVEREWLPVTRYNKGKTTWWGLLYYDERVHS